MEITKSQIENLAIIIESQAFEGVYRVANKVANDFEKVFGIEPKVYRSIDEAKSSGARQLVIAATDGASEYFADADFAEVAGKWEVWSQKVTTIEDLPAIVILGSDKRGTIYGLFALSEYIGVTPLVFFGDVEPAKRDSIKIGADFDKVTKEPSVKYRGFFINDEWPCFGNWTMEHFGGFTAEMYDHVYEFLLRMKGNYMWPAMWTSSFCLDGPGSLNEELADIYGVVYAYSHHEPCLRASEEWDKVRGEDSVYGNEWNFYTNEEGLLKYWEDALKRSGKYENIITIGMRGERDSSMLGDDSSLAQNIDLLKDIIKKQRDLIEKNVDHKTTQLLALYKEVEAYFYGDDKTPGLKDWDELDDVILMLCEDNYGHMRTLPREEMRGHKGGWGMYYHFDYHGGPISYEWIDSTPLSQTWEQMCQAYEYGIRDVWIVNVGDLKLHEVPLTYFMALAYDYDKWGYSNHRSAEDYMAWWATTNFPNATGETKADMARLFKDYIHLNFLRRPEANHAGVFHPCNYMEADRIISKAKAIYELSDKIYSQLPDDEKDAFYSCMGFSAKAGANLMLMHQYSAKNSLYASQGRPIANYYRDLCLGTIENDKALADEFGKFRDGKWNGMQLASHIGFTKWNDDDYRNPVLSTVIPTHVKALKVSRHDDARICVKNYGGPMRLPVPDFIYEGVEKVCIDISNCGEGELPIEIKTENGAAMPKWLKAEIVPGEIPEQKYMILTCNRAKLTSEIETVSLLVVASEVDATVAVDVAGCQPTLPKQKDVFMPVNGIIVMKAEHFAARSDSTRGRFEVITSYGKYDSGVKVFPSTQSFDAINDTPSLTYRFFIPDGGEYAVELMTAPNNPVYPGTQMRLGLVQEGAAFAAVLLDEKFKAGDHNDPTWSAGVLNQIHDSRVTMNFKRGVNELEIRAMDPGVVLEQIVIYRADTVIPTGYMGPEESPRT